MRNVRLEDRVPERKVFQGITAASAYQAMLRACRTAKVPHYFARCPVGDE